MKKIKIEKFCEGKHIDTTNVPVLLVSMVSKFLPKSALTELEGKGIYIEKMVELSKSSQDFCSELDVVENGKTIRVKISLVD